MGRRRVNTSITQSRFILHRFNGDEVYSFKSAVMWAYTTERGVTLWFEVEADPQGAQRCQDTAEMRMWPYAEVGVELPVLDANALVGREFSIPGTKRKWVEKMGENGDGFDNLL